MPDASPPRPASRFAHLELRHLAALDAVADAGTFGKAAARLGYTQSSVSHQIAALERAVGGPVFDRPGGPRPVQLTPLGGVVLAHARDLLTRAEAARTAIERFHAGEGRVDIGTFQTVSSSILPPILRRLRDEHPAVDVRLVEEGPAVELLLAGDLDVLFWDVPFWTDRKDVRVAHRKLLDDPYVLVACRGDFDDDPVALERLDGAAMVAHPSIFDQAQVKRALAVAGVRPRIAFRAADNGTVLSMVRAGMGSALMPLLAANLGPDDGSLRAHALEPPIPPREICVIWLAGRTLSPVAQRVIDIAVEVAALAGCEGSA